MKRENVLKFTLVAIIVFLILREILPIDFNFYGHNTKYKSANKSEFNDRHRSRKTVFKDTLDIADKSAEEVALLKAEIDDHSIEYPKEFEIILNGVGESEGIIYSHDGRVRLDMSSNSSIGLSRYTPLIKYINFGNEVDL